MSRFRIGWSITWWATCVISSAVMVFSGVRFVVALTATIIAAMVACAIYELIFYKIKRMKS